MGPFVNFKLQEEGHFPSGTAFQRYQAILQTSTDEATPPKAATVQEWTQAMLAAEDSSNTLESFLEILQTKNPYRAFFFETRPVMASTMATKAFEFVLVDAPSLYDFATSHPDAHAFGEYFDDCNSGGTHSACVFRNLSGDATLIAPKPIPNSDLTIFSHLADFCRKAKPKIVAETWKLAIQAYVDQVERQSDRNLWFSTSGLGIAWLHFRIDRRPKYYTYAAFRLEK